MRTIHVLAAAAVLISGSTAARADFFDVVGKVGKVAQAVNDTHESLAKGELPTAALKNAGGKKSGGKSKKRK